MEVTLAKLALLVGGRVVGDPDVAVRGAAVLDDAGPGDITLASTTANVKKLAGCRAAAVVVPPDSPAAPLPHIVADEPLQAFAAIVTLFRPRARETFAEGVASAHVHSSASLAAGVHVGPGAFIGENVTIGPRTVIYPNAVIMAGSQIGADTQIFPNAVLYENTRVGDRCRIHAGVVLGADGFGYDMRDGAFRLSPQLGWVELGDDVELGANTTIDRGTFGPTSIGQGTKIDDQVMIGHNCRIGKHNLLCSQVGIAGSCTTSDYVVMAGQAGVRDHVRIGAGVQLGAQSGVANDILEPGEYFGSPAMPSRQQRRILGNLLKITELRRELRDLRKKVELLTSRTAQPPAVADTEAA